MCNKYQIGRVTRRLRKASADGPKASWLFDLDTAAWKEYQSLRLRERNLGVKGTTQQL